MEQEDQSLLEQESEQESDLDTALSDLSLHVTSSNVLRVASTRGVIPVKSILSPWGALLNLATCGGA